MTIKGTLTKSETNNFGYTVIWVQGTRYGSDKKGTIQAQAGDTVEFEAFDKPSNKGDGKTWPTFQYQTFRKVEGSVAPVATVTASAATTKPAFSAAGRDSYWADKEARDIKKDERYQAETEPRIVFQSSYEHAIAFADLALRNGAFDALAKAKPTARLEVLQAFVSEQALRIMAEAYAARQPALADIKAVVAAVEDMPEADTDDSAWS